MADNPSPESSLPSALALVQSLAERGITFVLRSNRLWLQPAKEYQNLTDEERAVIRHRRKELKQLVEDGLPPLERPAPSLPPDPPPEKSEPKLPEHIRRIVEWNTPAERERRAAEATDQMLVMIGRRNGL